MRTFPPPNVCDAQSRSGVPAILIYKKGDLIGNLLGIDRDLTHEFYPVDLENYLIE